MKHRKRISVRKRPFSQSGVTLIEICVMSAFISVVLILLKAFINTKTPLLGLLVGHLPRHPLMSIILSFYLVCGYIWLVLLWPRSK